MSCEASPNVWFMCAVRWSGGAVVPQNMMMTTLWPNLLLSSPPFSLVFLSLSSPPSLPVVTLGHFHSSSSSFSIITIIAAGKKTLPMLPCFNACWPCVWCVCAYQNGWECCWLSLCTVCVFSISGSPKCQLLNACFFPPPFPACTKALDCICVF